MNDTFSPTGTTLLYFTIMASNVPSIPPISGPMYGMMLNTPVMKAMPMDTLKPRRAMKNSPRKLSNATPIISITTPEKYLDSNLLMSDIAAVAFSSCLSGTNAPIILLNSLLSFIKKKLMNMTENKPIPTLDMIEAAEPRADENIDTLNRFCNSLNMAFSILKSAPNDGKVVAR